MKKHLLKIASLIFVLEMNKCKCFRINFSTPSDEQLERGIMLLAKTIDEMKV